MVWSDEFDGNGEIDQGKWNFEAFEPGANNNELQKYTWNRTENCRRQDGVLVLEGRRDWWWDEGNQKTYEWTSARIQTAGKFSTKYGKLEMRAQMPWANGAWPAFWMMPQKSLYGGWPDSGEIDILEYVGWDNDNAHFNAHTKDHNFLNGNNYGWGGWIGGMENSYHTFAIEWWYDRIDFYIDGIWRYGFANEDSGPGQWPFNSEFFIILNHAIGGDWGGVMGIDHGAYETAGDNFGVGFFVDWVRVHKWDWPDHDIPAHVEAEHYEGYGGDFREEKCQDIGGGWGIGYIDDGDYFQYKINVPTSAWYQIDYRIASDNDEGVITLGKGGKDIKQTAVPDTGGWQSWWTVSDAVWLEKGSQTLDVYATKGGWNLNHFKINKAPPATQMEAEHYAHMWGVQVEDSEDLGGGHSVGYIDDRDWMSFPVFVPATGDYKISYRVASKAGGGIITLGKDGTDLQQTPAPSTGDWQSWTTITDVARLEGGWQTLTVFATKGGWNLNWWRYELLDADYSSWEEFYGIADSERSGNPDGDEWNNEREYYFGLNPKSAIENLERIPHTWIHEEGKRFPAFTFSKRPVSSNVNYLVETSSDLVTWTRCSRNDNGEASHTYTQINASDPHDDGSETISIRYNNEFTALPTGTLYFRLRVEE